MFAAYVSVQKLSQFSCSDQASDATPWLWTVLDQITASHHQSAESDQSIVVEARVAAFFRLMSRLPSTAIVTCQRSPTVEVHGLVQLQNAVNDLARNMTDVCTLPADLTLHLVLALASLPVEVNDQLRHFLTDCPLITLSAMHHLSTTTSAINMAHCANAMTDMLGTISLALDEATTLLTGVGQPGRSSLPAWLRAAALWSQLYNGRYTGDVSSLRTDSETAELLLLCCTVDMAVGMLRGDRHRQMVEDTAVAVWHHHVDALHGLADHDYEHSPATAVFLRCVPDILQSLQAIACLQLFVHATSRDPGHFSSRWNITRTLHWYIQCVQMFESGKCAVMTVLMLLQQASQAICLFAAKMSPSQLRTIDQTTLDALDPHICVVFQQLRDA